MLLHGTHLRGFRVTGGETERETKMTKILSATDKVLQFLYDYIMMISGSAVVLLIMAGAFMRYVLKIDFYGSSELILLAGYWLYFIGSISAARNNTHLSADMVSVFTSKQSVIRVCALIRDIIALLISLLAIKWCADYWAWNWNLHPVTSVLRIPKTLQQFPMCLAFVLWGVYLIRDCILAVISIKKGSAEGGREA